MKSALYILTALCLLGGCKKEEYGNLRQEIKCSSQQSDQRVKSAKTNPELRYTQFGDYIASITPTSFIGELEAVRYSSDNAAGSFLTLVHREPNEGEQPVLADFSSNATLAVVPTLNGTNIVSNADGQGGFYRDDVTFNDLWVRMGIKQVFELPAAYSQISLNQFGGSQRVNNTVTTDAVPFFQAVDALKTLPKAFTIFFRKTENTYIEYQNYYGGHGTLPHIRSSYFTDWTMTPPAPDQTKTVVTTIGFYNENIIQVYAGADNTPYTSDDVFVYEPNFWERIYVDVDEN